MIFFPTPNLSGIKVVSSFGDGYTINIKWHQAYATKPDSKIAYNIYYSTVKTDIFVEGIKFVSIDSALEANIINLVPGQDYFFCIRPVEYSLIDFNLNLLPIAHDNLRFYPCTLLRSNILSNSLIIPLLDIEGFTSTGLIKIGSELIKYSAIDTVNNNLLLSSLSQRGAYDSRIRIHNVNGFDGYRNQNPSVSLFTYIEDTSWDRIFVCQSRFEYPSYQFTYSDGYHQKTKDLLHTDLEASDNANVNFPMYDYAGYHRVDPVLMLTGECVGSYSGGEQGCVDGYGNVNMIRGLSLQDRNNQRQEILLSLTGREAVLIQRQFTGITCKCYLPSSEYPDDRCIICFGSGVVVGYQQYFNPRQSNGRIKVRIGPTTENTKMKDAGLESEFPIDVWTLTVPTIKTRDIIILFDTTNINEEFRYEVGDVTRNNTLIGMQGGQHFKATRIRKFDSVYQINAFKDTSTIPTNLETKIAFVPGIPPHKHSIRVNENNPSTWAQLTTASQGHSHVVNIVNGLPVVEDCLGHTHDIII